ncbi:hypothetical protein NM208_g582 [Fusarium decemcellulare]|uniref:Uncharacterized protein n=1 Tax=Fusarium decemcellulare TaxID=57161 RepID=A0ACC1SZ79_9HYPO|nr:hypothetical protein NM208_g582 [Fusarium decemcellulare]
MSTENMAFSRQLKPAIVCDSSRCNGCNTASGMRDSQKPEQEKSPRSYTTTTETPASIDFSAASPCIVAQHFPVSTALYTWLSAYKTPLAFYPSTSPFHQQFGLITNRPPSSSPFFSLSASLQTSCPSGNPSSAPATSNQHSSHHQDLGFLDLLPTDYYDFGNLDTEAIYQDLDASVGSWDATTGAGLFEGVMPDLTLNAEAQTAFGLGDDIFTHAHPLLTLDSTPLDHQPTATLAPPTTMPSKSPSVPGTSTFSLHPSPSSTNSSKRKHSSDEEEESEKTIKRQRNTIAARKYRQKRLDRISELERALEAMTGERDDLRLQLARREAEVDALREMLGKK